MQVPDPTGFNGRILSTDGANLLWVPMPEIPEPPAPDIVVSELARTFQAGVSDETGKFFVMCGSGTAPATGQLTSSVSISFDPAFSVLFYVGVSPQTTGVTSNSPPAIPSWAVTGYTPGSPASSATVTFYAPPVQTISSEDTIANQVPFNWVAIGIRSVSP